MENEYGYSYVLTIFPIFNEIVYLQEKNLSNIANATCVKKIFF